MRHVRGALLFLAAILAACNSTQASAGASASPSSSRQSNIQTCADTPKDAKCSTPPPGYTPQPAAPCDRPLTTPADVQAATADWGAPPGQTRAPGTRLPVGEPLLVHALRVGDRDQWLVPVLDGKGGATQVIAVGVRADGRGCAGMSSSWAGPFPGISIDAARARTAGPNDPIAFIEAVYLPFTRELPPSNETSSVWRAVRQSGREVFLFVTGDLYEGWWVRAKLATYTPGVALRGDPTGAVRPTLPPTIRYPVDSPEHVLTGMATDPFVLDQLKYLRAETREPHTPVLDPHLDRPVRVRGLHKPYTIDVWLVPVRDRSGGVVSVLDVSISDDGLGSAFEARGWSGPFPAISAEEAMSIGSAAGDPAISAELGWAEEYFVAPGGVTAPAWLVTRRSGARVVVTENRTVVPEPH